MAYGMTKRTHRNGNTTATYETDRKGPGETVMTVRWSNPVKARRAQERIAAKGRREERKRMAAAKRENRRKPYHGPSKKRK